MKTIPLTQGKEAIVDDDVYPIVNKYKWFTGCYGGKYFYGIRNINISKLKRSMTRLHWFIVGQPMEGLVVDHINGNTLDNRRVNLRIVTKRDNGFNRKSHRSGQLQGAHYEKRKGKFQSVYKHKFLGYFDNQIDAHNRFLQARAMDENISMANAIRR